MSASLYYVSRFEKNIQKGKHPLLYEKQAKPIEVNNGNIQDAGAPIIFYFIFIFFIFYLTQPQKKR